MSRREDGELKDCSELNDDGVEVNNNSLCDRAYESCAWFSVNGASQIRCILTAYCGKSYRTDGLVYGPDDVKIVREIECRDGAR